MMRLSIIILLLLPELVGAQTGNTGSLQSLLVGIGGFLNAVVIPFLLAIAFIVFVVNVVRFFVLQSTTDDGKKNAKNLAIYGIGAFVFILSFWGIINLLVNSIGLEVDPCQADKTSDYISQKERLAPCNTTRPRPNPHRPPDNPRPVVPDPINPIDPTDPRWQKRQALNEAKAEVQRNASIFERLFNQYRIAIKNNLFSILTQAGTPAPDVATAVEMRRAAGIGLIPQEMFQRFLDALRAEQIAQGQLQPITPADIDRLLPGTPPPAVIDSINRVRSEIEASLITYQGRVNINFAPPLTLNGQPATPQQVIDYLYNQSIPASQRHDYFVSLIENPHDIIDPSRSNQLYEDYIASNNASAIYAGYFTMMRQNRGPQ